MRKFFGILTGLLILLSGTIAIGIYWTFYRPLPEYNITLEQPELNQPVDLYWDSHGVPHIYSQNKEDLYYSLGYAHAQDRLWQMTVTQMAAEGRFAEFLGKELLPLDITQRTLGFWRMAQKIETTLSDSTRNYLEAYSKGVNAYADQHPKSLPIQFSLTDMEPIPWTPTHSVALARMMAWELNLAWRSELTYAYLFEQLPGNQFQQILPDNRFFSFETAADTTDSLATALLPFLENDQRVRRIIGAQGTHTGSNAWAVNANKSTTESPLLGGDPHLALSIPGKWYEVHLNVNDQNLSGATIPGAPMVVLGRNDRLAWSLTNIMLDDTDFFEEAVNPDNPDEYLLDSLAGEPLYESFEEQQEVIPIKNEGDTVFTRRLTKHGPVISDIYPDQQLIGDRVITMKWTGHEVSNEVEALLGMNWAQSFEAFREHACDFKVPGQHFVYADRDGNIARLALASVPVRDNNPILFREGWDPSQDWRGYVPYEELPSEINPDRGWVANANQKPVNNNYPHYLSIYWEDNARYDRITQYMAENEQLSPEIFQQMQNDSRSLYAKKLMDQILPVLKENPDRFDTVISYLENWDFSYNQSETAASIMDVFMLRLSQNTFADEMTEPVYESFIKFTAIPERTLIRLLQDGSSFFDNINTDEQETREQIINRSMDQTISFLRSRFGPEPFEWRWEQLHTITLKPELLGEAADQPEAPSALKLIVENLLSIGPLPVRGHSSTLNNGEYDWNDPYEMTLGPSIRRIIDFSEPGYTLSILPTGQSENPFSPYYGNQTQSWIEGQYKRLYRDSTFFNNATYETMRLIPAN